MHSNPELLRLIHDNLWTVISYAFGRPKIEKVMAANIEGSWPPLEKNVRETAEVRADRALLEMATQLRAADHVYKIDEYQKTRSHPWSIGRVTQADGTVELLWFRDFTNKVLHGASYQWDLQDEDRPKIIITPTDGLRWLRAEVDIVPMMMLVGELSF